MTIIDFLSIHTPYLLVFTAIFGLIIGSFLNVVIYRLPIMLHTNWLNDCSDFLKEQHSVEIGPMIKTETKPSKSYNLMVPRSACPKCNHQITALENIPVISYLFLLGKCSACKNPIPIRYPLIEILTSVLTLLTVLHFGLTIQCAAALLLGYALIALSFIDIDHLILPDDVTLTLLWVGLGLNVFGIFTDAHSAILGAIFGYMSLWTLFWAFKLLTGKDGMGYGDFKLLSVFGAWLGWQLLPLILLLSSLIGTIIGISIILIKKHERSKPFPFGPYLAIAGWIALLWGDRIIEFYLNFAKIT